MERAIPLVDELLKNPGKQEDYLSPGGGIGSSDKYDGYFQDELLLRGLNPETLKPLNNISQDFYNYLAANYPGRAADLEKLAPKIRRNPTNGNRGVYD
jgi:phospholipid N-methyltransferase